MDNITPEATRSIAETASLLNPWDLPCVPIERKSDLPPVTGVYIAVRNDAVLYVGKSINIKDRWVSHHRHDQLALMDNVLIAYYETDTEENALRLEALLIDRFIPRMNKVQVLGSPDDIAKMQSSNERLKEENQGLKEKSQELMAQLDELKGRADKYEWLSNEYLSLQRYELSAHLLMKASSALQLMERFASVLTSRKGTRDLIELGATGCGNYELVAFDLLNEDIAAAADALRDSLGYLSEQIRHYSHKDKANLALSLIVNGSDFNDEYAEFIDGDDRYETNTFFVRDPEKAMGLECRHKFLCNVDRACHPQLVEALKIAEIDSWTDLDDLCRQIRQYLLGGEAS